VTRGQNVRTNIDRLCYVSRNSCGVHNQDFSIAYEHTRLKHIYEFYELNSGEKRFTTCQGFWTKTAKWTVQLVSFLFSAALFDYIIRLFKPKWTGPLKPSHHSDEFCPPLSQKSKRNQSPVMWNTIWSRVYGITLPLVRVRNFFNAWVVNVTYWTAYLGCVQNWLSGSPWHSNERRGHWSPISTSRKNSLTRYWKKFRLSCINLPIKHFVCVWKANTYQLIIANEWVKKMWQKLAAFVLNSMHHFYTPTRGQSSHGLVNSLTTNVKKITEKVHYICTLNLNLNTDSAQIA